MEFLKVILRNKRNKIILGLLVVSYSMLLVLPFLQTLRTNPFVMESNLSSLDALRSILLFVLDSILTLTLTVWVFGILGVIFLKRRLTVLKRMLGMSVLFMTLLSTTLIAPIGAQENPERELPLVKKVFIITFDGTRADVFWEHATWIINHKNESTWAYRIVCEYPTVTYPNHESIATGAWPQIHGVEANSQWISTATSLLRKFRQPRMDDIFDIADTYGIMTALFLAPPVLLGIMGNSHTYKKAVSDSNDSMTSAINYIKAHATEIDSKGFLAMIHLVDSDTTGHAFGSNSLQYAAQIKKQADLVGDLYSTIIDLGWENDSIIIVTADHGFYGFKHLNVWPPLVADIPLWMWGKPIRKNFQLGGGRLVDITPTVAFILGIPTPSGSIGVPLLRALDEDFVKSIRGDVNLSDLAIEKLSEGLFRTYLDILLWGFIDLSMLWSSFILVYSNLLLIKEVSRKSRELRIRTEKG